MTGVRSSCAASAVNRACCVNAASSGIQYARELAEFAVSVRNADALGEVAGGNFPGRGTDVTNGAQRTSDEPCAHGKTQQQHRRPDAAKPPRELMEADGIGGDGAADENAIAGTREKKRLAELAALPGGRIAGFGCGQIVRRGGRISDGRIAVT